MCCVYGIVRTCIGRLNHFKKALIVKNLNKIIKNSYILPWKKCSGDSSYFVISRPWKNLLPNNSGRINVPYFDMPIRKGLNSTHSENIH
jgi:hypothetical protein